MSTTCCWCSWLHALRRKTIGSSDRSIYSTSTSTSVDEHDELTHSKNNNKNSPSARKNKAIHGLISNNNNTNNNNSNKPTPHSLAIIRRPPKPKPQIKRLSDADYDFSFKIIMCGSADVGKTALLRRLEKGTFTPTKTVTRGIEFSTHVTTVRDDIVQLQVWDIAGPPSPDRGANIPYAYFKGAVGVIMVFDVMNRASFEQLQNFWLPSIHAMIEHDVRILLVANKCDQEQQQQQQQQREVSYQEAELWAESKSIPLIETSAFSGKNVNTMLKDLVHSIYATSVLDNNSNNNNDDSGSTTEGTTTTTTNTNTTTTNTVKRDSIGSGGGGGGGNGSGRRTRRRSGGGGGGRGRRQKRISADGGEIFQFEADLLSHAEELDNDYEDDYEEDDDIYYEDDEDDYDDDFDYAAATNTNANNANARPLLGGGGSTSRAQHQHQQQHSRNNNNNNNGHNDESISSISPSSAPAGAAASFSLVSSSSIGDSRLGSSFMNTASFAKRGGRRE